MLFSPPPEGARFALLEGRFFGKPTKNAPLETALPPLRGLLSGQAPGATVRPPSFVGQKKTKSTKN
jgi:hypothetical protein